MIRPWYRSRLFWLGIPGLLFLLWGWVDCSAPPSLTTQLGNSRVTVGNGAGTLRIVWVTQSSGSGFTIAGRTGTRAPDLIHPFPPAIRQSTLELIGGGRHRTLVIGYWFLIVLYLPLWLGVFAARRRYQVRLLESSCAPPP